jgi:hypothetical protein
LFLSALVGTGICLASLTGGNSIFVLGIFELIILTAFITWWKKDFRFSSKMTEALEEIKAAKEKNYKKD